MAERSDRMTAAAPKPEAEVLDRVATALHGLRFGSVEITVHEGEVVQIERRERERIHPKRGRN